MAFDYSTIAATGLRLISEYGKSITVKRVNRVFDTDKPWKKDTSSAAEQPDTDHTVMGVIADFNHREVDGEIIQTGDRRLLVAAQGLAFEFDLRDLIVDGSDQWRIVNINTVAPGATTLLYDLQLRQ